MYVIQAEYEPGDWRDVVGFYNKRISEDIVSIAYESGGEYRIVHKSHDEIPIQLLTESARFAREIINIFGEHDPRGSM